MRRILCIFVFLSLCLTLPSQEKLYTRKARLEDFYSKTTMVVLGGHPLVDALLREAVITGWRVSPYEFCSLSEYEDLKSSSEYYFLSVVSKEDEPGLVFLNFSKGGSTKKTADLESAFDILLFPFDRDDFSLGRAGVYLEALVDFVQIYTEEIRVSEKKTVLGLSGYNKNMSNLRAPVYISEDDLAPGVQIPEGFIALPSEEVNSIFEKGKSLVALSFFPEMPLKGTRSYQVIISSETHEFLYYDVHPFNAFNAGGFTADELYRIVKYLDRARR